MVHCVHSNESSLTRVDSCAHDSIMFVLVDVQLLLHATSKRV